MSLLDIRHRGGIFLFYFLNFWDFSVACEDNRKKLHETGIVLKNPGFVAA